MDAITPLARRSSFQKRASDLPPGNCFVRMLTAKVVASVSHCPISDVVAQMWPHDRVVAELVERAASAPAMTQVAGWAAELAQRFIVDTMDAMGPVSGGAQLLRQSLLLSFNGAGRVSVPGFVADVADAAWVAEGDPIPVNQMPSAAANLDPFKIGSIAVLSREMIESSNAEQLVSNTLIRAAGLALDAALFDANAATTARPAGLRNGISTLTASVITDFYEAIVEDVGNLISAVSSVGGAGPYAIVVKPGRIASLRMNFAQETPGLVLIPATAVGNVVMGVATQALVAAVSANPEVEVSQASTLHMSDAPVAVGPAAATPSRSLWQTDSIAIKVRWPCTWALRDSRAVAWLTPAWK